MSIYSISWTSFGSYGLSAAVVAENEEEAVKALNFSEDEATELQVIHVGVALEGVKPHVIAHESL